MKILLTGPPKIGKTTVLQKVKEKYEGKIFGVVANEIREKNGDRIGFKSVNHKGKSKTFAHKYDIKSKYVVDSKYFVDLKAIDTFVVPEIEKGLKDEKSLVFIDEIGRMQSFSKKFLKTVSRILKSDANVLATIVSDPESWSLGFKNHSEVLLIEVNKENRDNLPELLSKILNNIKAHKNLSQNKKEKVLHMARVYFRKGNYIQIKKLFNNALSYVIRNKIKELKRNKNYSVKGFTRNHKVKLDHGKFSCDCDLYNGRNKYQNNAGECSHIQAVKLFIA